MDQPIPPVPDSHRDLLERPLIAQLATIREDGGPQVNPMWFEWDGRRIRMTHTRTRQKFRNLSAEPRVALSISDPDDDQRYLEVRGVVEAIQDDPGGEFYRGLRRRYGSNPDAPMPDEAVRVVVVIAPATMLARSPARGGGAATIDRVSAAGRVVLQP